MSAQVARRRQRHRRGGEDRCDQRGETEKLLGAVERLPDLGPEVAYRFEPLTALEPRLGPVAIRVAAGARDEQPPRGAIAGLQQPRRRHVVDVDQHFRAEREQAAGDFRILLHDRRNGQRRIADAERVTDLGVEPRREPRVDPRFAAPRNAARRATCGIVRVEQRDRSAQRVSRADRLDVGEHRVAAVGARSALHHAVEADRGHDGEPARARLGRERIRQRPIGGDQQVGAEQHVRLARERALDPVREQSHRPDARHREHQRREQHRELAGAPVAAKHHPGKPQRVHANLAITRAPRLRADRRPACRRRATGAARSATPATSRASPGPAWCRARG